MRTVVVSIAVVLGIMGVAGAADGPSAVRRSTRIEAQSLDHALQALANERDLALVYRAELVAMRQAPRVEGQLTVDEALARLLAGTDLTWKFLDEKTVTIVSERVGEKGARHAAQELTGAQAMRLAQVEGGGRTPVGGASPDTGAGEEGQSSTNTDNTATTFKKAEEEDPDGNGIPEILVTGSKLGTLNMDIKRTEDDIQPYVVFHRDVIERSGASDLGQFFKNELTSNIMEASSGQSRMAGNRSTINLRGLGTDETLILVDGRRIAQINTGYGDLSQGDINGIPLAAIERIEVLPTTASGIYGGGATGGVINIVLRRDYSGADVKLTYGNTLDSDVASRRIEISGGMDLGNSRTSLMFLGSYADSNPLLEQERNLMRRARAHRLANNPGFFFAAASPPLGATPNICSATFGSCDDTPLVLDDGTSLGSPITFVPPGYLGGDGGAALVDTAGRYNLDLADTAQPEGARFGLLNTPVSKSLMVTMRHEFTERWQTFLDIQASDTSSRFAGNNATATVVIAGDAPNNPFQQPIQVTVPAIGMDTAFSWEGESHKVTLGMIAKVSARWQAEMDFTWNRYRNSGLEPGNLSGASFDAMSSGSLDVLRDLNLAPVAFEAGPPLAIFGKTTSTLKNTSLRLAGPLPWSLPAGDVMVSTLLEHRDESLGDRMITSGTRIDFVPSRQQTVDSIYLETRLPLVSAGNQIWGVENLDLQVAVRADEYRVEGVPSLVVFPVTAPVHRRMNKNSSVDPTVGLRYQPIPDLTLRTSFGTGYRPPAVDQLGENLPEIISLSHLTDPLRNDEALGVAIAVRTGGNPNLTPESSESWSAGMILTPRWVPGLRLTGDWSRVSKTDNIGFLALFTQANLELGINYFPDRVLREEPSDGFSVGRIIGLESTLVNIAHVTVEAVDLGADYTLQASRFGDLTLSVDATRLISAKTQATPVAPTVENAGVWMGFIDGVGGAKWRASARLNWSYREWNLGWSARFYASSFLNRAHTLDISQGSATLPSQLYHDVYGGYRFADGSSHSVLSDVEIRFGVSNLFNTKPPINLLSVPPYSMLADPRLARYYVSVQKSFGF